MTITCIKCGENTFSAGDIQPTLDGGYDVVMTCRACGTPNTVLHDEDPEFAKALGSFFTT